VAVVQIPTFSLDGDVAATGQVIDALPGPVTLAGHSYGGAVITEAGNHHKVRSLAGSFAADLPRAEAEFLADSQVPWGLDALHGQVSEPAWRTKPAWYLVAGSDRVIPPPAQRAMAGRIGARTVEVPGGSHFVCLCQPAAVAGLIREAARS